MGLLPGRYNFKIWKGATISKQIDLRDRLGAPINLAGYTAKLELPGLELTDANGLTINDDGSITLNITPEQTNALTWKRANYQLLLSSPDEVYPVLTGQVIVLGI